MEEGNKLYPWFVFILFVFPYILRALREKKAKEAKRREEAADNQRPTGLPKRPVAAVFAPPRAPVLQKRQRPVEKKPFAVKPKPAFSVQPPPSGVKKRKHVKRLMRELPTQKQLIVLGEIIGRKEW